MLSTGMQACLHRRDARAVLVALPPECDSYALRDEQSKRSAVPHRQGLTGSRKGLAEAESRR
jgi:hypothetical protein